MAETSETRTVVYGASDDLLEIGGHLAEEFDNDQDEVRYVGFANGVLLKMTCDDEGFWRITPRAGGDRVEIIFARGEVEGSDDDGCPGYSDKAVLLDAGSWVTVGSRAEVTR